MAGYLYISGDVPCSKKIVKYWGVAGAWAQRSEPLPKLDTFWGCSEYTADL